MSAAVQSHFFSPSHKQVPTALVTSSFGVTTAPGLEKQMMTFRTSTERSIEPLPPVTADQSAAHRAPGGSHANCIHSEAPVPPVLSPSRFRKYPDQEYRSAFRFTERALPQDYSVRSPTARQALRPQTAPASRGLTAVADELEDYVSLDAPSSFRRSLTELPARHFQMHRTGTPKWVDSGRGFHLVHEDSLTYNPDALARRHDIKNVVKKKTPNNFNHRRRYLANHVNSYDKF